jgi:hypothetical protein
MTTTAFDLDAQLLPDETCWGPGYGPGSRYPEKTLAEIAQWVSETVQPGYGPRLHATSPGYQPGTLGRAAQLPPGFDATGHPNRAGAPAAALDVEIPTSLEQPAAQVPAALQEYSRARGWVLDQHGRPLHPHHEQLLADPRIGLPTSTGSFWHHAEAVVADGIVTAAAHVLLTTRPTDQGRIPCLTGGYAVPADFGRTLAQWRAGDRMPSRDGIAATAARKITEETGFSVPPDARVRIVRAIRPISSPHTLNAWTTTYTVHFDLGLGGSLPAIDPAGGGSWVRLDHGFDDVLPTLWPDHARALAAAVS